MKKFILTVLMCLVCSVGWCGIKCDGIDDEISMDNDSSIQAQRPMSLSTWIKRDATGETDVMFWKRGNNGGFQFQINSSDLIAFTFFGVADVFSTGTITDTNWHHVGITISSSGTVTYYIDGDSIDTDSISAPVIKTEQLHFCVTTLINGVPNGWTDQTQNESAMWTSELTANDMALLGKSKVKRMPCQIDPSNRSFYIPLDDVSDGSSADGVVFNDPCGNLSSTGDDGANNTGLTGAEEKVLTYQ